jgi:Polyketide cyclase / dehydrase and lipid transport
MPDNAYHYVTTWQVPATREEIVDILSDAPGLARWWPSVYLQVREVSPGDERGLGKVVDLWTKGFLPYTLRWRFEITRSDAPHGFTLAARGDFVGIGIWTLTPVRSAGDARGPLTTVTYDWSITAEKGMLKRSSGVLKPVFGANHNWAMRRGEESLLLELARRHAGRDPLLGPAIKAPPGPIFPHNVLRRLARSR